MSYGGSTAPTSCAPSQCGDGTDTVTPDAAGRRVSQLRRLAAVAGLPVAPAWTSRVYQSPVQSHTLSGSSSVTTFQAQHTVQSYSDHFQTCAPALQQTQSSRDPYLYPTSTFNGSIIFPEGRCLSTF